MPLLRVETPWAYQPQEAVRLSPRWRCVSALQLSGAVGRPIDAAPGSVYTAQGTASTQGKLRTRVGTGDTFHPSGGSLGVVRLMQTAGILGDASDFSVVGVFHGLSSLATDGFHIGRGGVSDSVRVYYVNSTTIRFAWIDSSPAQYNLDLNVGTYAIGEVLRIAVTKRGTTRAIYVQRDTGARFAASQTSGLPTARAAAGNGFNIGATLVVGAGGVGHFGASEFMVFEGALSEGSVWSLLQNPWQVYEPARHYIVTSGGGGTPGNASGGTLTATASLISGAASAGAEINGALITALASIIAGTASGGSGVNVSGETLTAVASILSGGVSAGATVGNALINASTSIIPGAASAEGSTNVSGALITASTAVINGLVTAGATLNGQLLQAAATIISGYASAGGVTQFAIRGDPNNRVVIDLGAVGIKSNGTMVILI